MIARGLSRKYAVHVSRTLKGNPAPASPINLEHRRSLRRVVVFEKNKCLGEQLIRQRCDHQTKALRLARDNG